MGMPTVSVYVLTATLLAPSLVKLGVTPMAAHMYVMYFGMLSMITPPVAIAAYAAANIARTSGWTTGWVSVDGRVEHVLHSVPVRDRAGAADGGQSRVIALACRAQSARHLRRHGGHRRVRLRGAAEAAAAIYFATAVAILIPPSTFPGAHVIDWIGLGIAAVLLGLNYLQSRAARAAPPAAATEH
jgi:ABC-type transport system involved in cytochrome c biogenesis permease subunit